MAISISPRLGFKSEMKEKRTFRTAVTTDISLLETLACAATVVVWSVYYVEWLICRGFIILMRLACPAPTPASSM